MNSPPKVVLGLAPMAAILVGHIDKMNKVRREPNWTGKELTGSRRK